MKGGYSDALRSVMDKIKNMDPETLANELVSVQPMTGSMASVFRMPLKWDFDPYRVDVKYNKDAVDVPDGYMVIETNPEIGKWIESHELHLWKYGDPFGSAAYDQYVIAEELFVWLKMRWG